ncbi:hypothetical protein ACFE04_020746 [Oxalis oulophora]
MKIQESVINSSSSSSSAMKMFEKKQLPQQLCIVKTPIDGSITIRRRRVSSIFYGINKVGKNLKKVENFANRVLDHVRLGAKMSDMVKGKLILGARIVQLGGVDKIFKQCFGVTRDEKLLRVSQCYLSTTANPIAGLLFISSHKIAFRSERSIKVYASNGESVLRYHYKVMIPITDIKRVDQCQNVEKPSQKYIEIVTNDHHEFWFMGFLHYHKSLLALQQAIVHSEF